MSKGKSLYGQFTFGIGILFAMSLFLMGHFFDINLNCIYAVLLLGGLHQSLSAIYQERS